MWSYACVRVEQCEHEELGIWHYIFSFPLVRIFQSFCFLSTFIHDSFITSRFSLNFSTIYLQYSSFSPSSITSIMNLGLWSVWGSKLLLTVASPTGCSHGAPNASLEYWINPTTTSVLSNQHRHYFLTITLHGGLVLWRMDGLWICCVVSEGRDNRHRQVEHLRLFYAIPFWLQSLPSQL